MKMSQLSFYPSTWSVSTVSVGNSAESLKRLFAVILAAAVLVFAGIAMSACSESADTTTEPTEFENRLQVGTLSLGYPNDMHEAEEESENGPIFYGDTVFGGAPTASAKAISKQDVVFTLSTAEENNGRTLADVDESYKTLEDSLNVTTEAGFTRLALSREQVMINGLDCVVIDTTISAPKQLGGGVGRGIIYVLLDNDGTIIGEVDGYFYGDDYDKDPARYDALFASVQQNA